MEEIELLFNREREEALIRLLDLSHCKYSSLLAQFLLALDYQYPTRDHAIEFQAFVSVAIDMMNV
jgi:hypothetical protein